MSEQKLILKVLLTGSVNGKLIEFYSKLDKLNKEHGPFDAIFSSGRVFGDLIEEHNRISSNNIKCPIPFYILGPQCDDDVIYYTELNKTKGLEILPNVFFMGQCGVCTLPSGLIVGFVSKLRANDGTWGIDQSSVDRILYRLEKNKNFKGVDFLITPTWPHGVLNGVPVTHSNYYGLSYGDEKISFLAKILKPRYHLAELKHKNPYFYERPPYRNHKPTSPYHQHMTRFISLAHFDNPDNQKWLYGIKISPLTLMPLPELTIQSNDVTDNPYFISSIRPVPVEQPRPNPPPQVIQEPVKQEGSPPYINVTLHHEVPDATLNCWFCLSNPNVEKHMIVHVATRSYLTLAKGGLVPYHVLICPVNHYGSLASLDEITQSEIESYKIAIKKMFKSNNMSCVIFERNYHSQHLQLQVIPMHKQNPRFLAQSFIDHGKKYNMNFVEIPMYANLIDMIPTHSPYFFAEFEDGIRLFHSIKGKIPLHFGREVLATPQVLALGQDRVDWKNCILGPHREAQLARELSALFKPFSKSVIY